MYTTVHLPASAINKIIALLCVKIETRASGGVLPLQLFKCLYPDHINIAGHPNDLNVSRTKLTAYIGTQIPLYGSLCGPITLQPCCPGATLHQIKSCWYVADTPGPAILSLPSCKKVEAVKMKCVVTVSQNTSKPQSCAPTPTTLFLQKKAN